MEKEACQATVHGVARVRHDLATRERERDHFSKFLIFFLFIIMSQY